MNRGILLAVTLILLLAIGLSGCINSDDYKEKILGKWLAGETLEGEDGSVIFNFFSNGSFYVNLTEIDESGHPKIQTAWMTYKISDEEFVMIIENNEIFLEYSFSDNYKTLNLLQKDGTSTILTKQQSDID